MFHDVVKKKLSVTTPKNEYPRNKYKQIVEKSVLESEFDDKCDDYWNISDVIRRKVLLVMTVLNNIMS